MDYFDFNVPIPELDQTSAVASSGHFIEGSSGDSRQDRTPVGTPGERPGPSGSIPVTISTAFQPNMHVDNLRPDIVLTSSDNVFFYVCLHRLLAASENGFNALLPPPSVSDEFTPVIDLPESADVLNVVLHSIYNWDASCFVPSYETLSAAIAALVRYGMQPKRVILPTTSLFSLLLAKAPFQPIDAYALAASYDLEDLAVAISPHLLAYQLHSLTDEISKRIGAVYLKRLFFLHNGRIDALGRLLLHPPQPHPETPECDNEQQRKLTRAWALASAHLVWDARPDLSTYLLQASLTPLERELSCDLCKLSLRERITALVMEWSAVKRTI